MEFSSGDALFVAQKMGGLTMAGLNKSHEPVRLLVTSSGFEHSCSADDIRAQVARIVVSNEFNRSPRLRRFLQFIVDESLSGREEQIKAYTIGLAVCDRDEQFDPSIDPIVRIEAGRLRRALEHYYLTKGAHDPITIDVPKGAYRPVITGRPESHNPELANPETPSLGVPPRALERFSESVLSNPAPVPKTASFFRRIAGEARAAWLVAALAVMSFILAVTFMDKEPGQNQTGIRMPAPSLSSELAFWRMPTLLVLPFHNDDGDTQRASVAQAVTEELTNRLMQQTSINVRRALNGDGSAITSLYESSPIDFVVSGNVRKVDNHVRFSVRLTNVRTETTVWSQSYYGEIRDDTIDQQDDIVQSIVAQVAKLSNRTPLLSN